jgi:hypothetical protein
VEWGEMPGAIRPRRILGFQPAQKIPIILPFYAEFEVHPGNSHLNKPTGRVLMALIDACWDNHLHVGIKRSSSRPQFNR